MNRIEDVTNYITECDEEVGKALQLELGRQRRNLELIASENIVSPAVMLAMGTVPTNKYAEGYPGKRYYGGCEDVDILENLAIERAKKLFKRLDAMGMQYCFTSNNKEPRVKAFCEAVGGKYYVYKANKPSIKGYETAMKLMGTDKKNTFFVGDQLFTDVYGANRTGIHSILVTPMNPKEEIQIVIKRYFEKIVLWQYRKKKH